MKLEDQVCSLASAQKLKELGCKQESLFIWKVDDRLDDLGYELVPVAGYTTSVRNRHNNYSAFTVAELGEMLPEYIGEWFLEMYKDSSNLASEEWFLVRYVERDGIGGEEIKTGFHCSNEAEARAKMLIYLLENKLI